jgi:hypothetical protein
VSVTTRSVTKTYDPPVARVAERTHRRVLPGVLFPVAVFVVWRLAQLAVTRLAHGDLVDTAFQWDGNAYRRILEHGYHIAPNEFRPVTAFFPGIAWVAKGPDLLVDHTTAMVLTANVVALLAFVAVWAVAREWRDERLARASVVLLALWPGTLFYWAFYSEALLVASTAGAVWFDRRGHRWPAALLLYVAALSRSVGISVALVMVGVRVVRKRRLDTTAVLYAVAAAAGILTLMYVQHHQAGDALAFVHDQRDWGRSLTFPWTTVREGIGALKSGQPRPAKWLDLIGITAMGLAVVWALWPRSRNARRRLRPLPPEAWLLTIGLLALPLCSGLMSSMNRFVAGTWPGFILLAAWLQTARPWLRWVVYGALAVACVLMTRYWARGTFIG